MRFFPWVLSIVLGCLVSGAGWAADPPRFNVVWISADDLAAYAIGCYGDTRARTPNLDAFAATAVRFDRAYCNSPVCTASRQSYLTGRYPRSVGVTQLHTALPPGTPNLATDFKAAGYDTAAIGKMHFNSPAKHGFDVRLDAPDHRKWLSAKGATPPPAGTRVQPPWKPFQDPARIWLNADVRPVAMAADMPGPFYAEAAADFISAKRDKPFFLMVSFTEPHSPFHFPVELAGTFDPAAFPVPPVGPADDAQIPEIFRDLTPAEKQGITAAYYTSSTFLDRHVGRVLEAIQQAGHAEDTLVVFTGDHGYLLGHHGRFEKHCHFEEAIRSPLMVRIPGVATPKATPAFVEFLDIAPTLLEACGLPVPERIQGRSLMPVLNGQSNTHRDVIFGEYSENEEAMVRTDRWKLIYSTGTRARQDGYATGRPLPGRTVQLFDLAADPTEMTNVADAHPDIVADLTTRLAEHLTRTAREPDLVPTDPDIHVRLAHLLQPRDVKRKQ